MRLASAFLLAALPATLAFSQTPAARKPTVHHRAPVAAASALPASIPKVVGIAKPLYSLRYIDTKIGAGPLAEPEKFYTVHYTGWLAKDGTKFDSSFDHPGAQPITFPYGAHRVIPGWDTGFDGMHVGGKRRLFIPWQLAYGDEGRPPVIPARADLIFDIELVGFSATPPAPPTPPAAPKPAAEPATPPTSTPATPQAPPPTTPPTQPETPPANPPTN
ncbi:MAG: FKBP-type peptidyl-prolyl cis-trans isomerase [Granulicella sp.]